MLVVEIQGLSAHHQVESGVLGLNLHPFLLPDEMAEI